MKRCAVGGCGVLVSGADVRDLDVTDPLSGEVTGCSNGGMRVYELAKDARTRTSIAGFMPQVGSPHPGFGGMEAMMWDFAGRHAKKDADPAACAAPGP